MDPINIIAGIALLLSIVANGSATKGGLKRSVTKSERKPKTYLQKVPLNISALVLILQLLSVFQLFGTVEYKPEYLIFRIIGLIFFILFAWMQVKSFKNLKSFYSQDISLQKNHQIISTGLHKNIRHPQYISQTLSDLFFGIAVGSYIIIPLVLLVQLPLFILRAKKEESMMLDYFGEPYSEYKKKSGFIIPFIG
jgi:protein-S-isoprenylcysteine O-methyltransferase Ste14